MANKVYLTGATGKLGSAVLSRINATPLMRKPSRIGRGILTDFSPGQLKNILKDADAIVHIAGSVETWDPKGLEEGNVELTKKIVDAAPDNCRIVFASSISVYGKELDEKPAKEETMAKPDSAYSRSKLEAEKLVAGLPNHVILRIGTVYGPAFKDYYRILSKIEQGKMKIIGDGKNRVPFVHVDDVADVIAAAVSKGKGTYVVAGEPLSQEQVFAIAAKELEVSPPKKKISRGLALFGAMLGEHWCKITGKRPKFTVEHVAVLSYDRLFDCSKAVQELGFSPRSLADGIREIVRAYKKSV